MPIWLLNDKKVINHHFLGFLSLASYLYDISKLSFAYYASSTLFRFKDLRSKKYI